MDTFLLDLEEEYKASGYNFKTALDTWKESRLSANDIKNIVKEDVGKEISYAQAKFLQRSGKELFEDNKIYSSFMRSTVEAVERQKEVHKRMATVKMIKLTPEVRRAVEKIGNNRFRSRYGSIEWSIVEFEGQPHLARREIADEAREEKVGEKE
jgi:hypothetical protein